MSAILFRCQLMTLQKALKEKEEHIEQLLKERDMERSEVARAAAQCDEVSLMVKLILSHFIVSDNILNELLSYL